jgi:hypothetical protein
MEYTVPGTVFWGGGGRTGRREQSGQHSAGPLTLTLDSELHKSFSKFPCARSRLQAHQDVQFTQIYQNYTRYDVLTAVMKNGM